MDKAIEEDCFPLIITEVILDEIILEKHEITENKIIGGYGSHYRNDNSGRGRNRSRDRKYLDNIRRNDKSSNRSRSGLRASTNRDRIRC